MNVAAPEESLLILIMLLSDRWMVWWTGWFGDVTAVDVDDSTRWPAIQIQLNYDYDLLWVKFHENLNYASILSCYC